MTSTSGAPVDAVGEDRVERQRGRACRGEPLAAEPAQHAEGVEHRLGDAVGGELAVAGEERLALET